jgi:predicted TIM-barrel fold metal-dependent hydrolase
MATESKTPRPALSLVLGAFLLSVHALSAQDRARLSSIPRVDVHAHLGGDTQLMEGYLKIAGILKDKHDVNMDIWIDLGSYKRLETLTVGKFKEVQEKYKGRFLQCISDYRIADGLWYTPEEIAEWQARGAAGYKIWVGVSALSDVPGNEPTFAKMEELGFLGASIHVSQPYPTKWCKSIIGFREAQNAWERVMDRHAKMKLVMAHMFNYNMSDEQLDYLQYVMETYPNVNLDLAARIGWVFHVDRDKLRDFTIRYADRILFGTDIADQPSREKAEITARRYHRCFEILETEKIVGAGFYPGPGAGTKKVKGMALPIDVLEKIYYKNAARLYPRVRDVLQQMGYAVVVKGQ